MAHRLPLQDTYVSEALAPTFREEAKHLEVQLGHVCNNRCVFCVSGQLTEQGLAKAVDTTRVRGALEAAAARGVETVTLLGGEPTLNRGFLDVARSCIELGFREVVIFTNGARGPNRAYLESLLDLGRFTWRFSLQGGDAESHEAVTRKRGSFARLLAGLDYLHAREQDITINACVNALNYRSLPLYPELMLRYGVRQLHLDMVRPGSMETRTDEEIRDVLVRYEDVATYARRMLRRFAELAPDFDVHLGNLPYCALPDFTRHIHHGGSATLTVTYDDDGDFGRVWHKYRYQSADAVHPEPCERCVFRRECRGLPEKYAQILGVGELTPVTAEKLRAQAPRHRDFAAYVRTHLPSLAAIGTAALPLTGVTERARERSVELEYRARNVPVRVLLTGDAHGPSTHWAIARSTGVTAWIARTAEGDRRLAVASAREIVARMRQGDAESATAAAAATRESTPAPAPALGATHIVRCDDLDGEADLVTRLCDGELAAVIVTGVFSEEELAGVANRLKSGTHGFDVHCAHPAGSRDADVTVLGKMIAPTALEPGGPEMSDYLEHAARFTRECDAVFVGADPVAARIQRVLSALGGGCPARVPRVDGADYSPATLRLMPEGCGAPSHRDQNDEAQSYAQLRALCDLDPQLSYYVPVALPRGGGELRVTLDPDDGHAPLRLRPGVGSLLVFCGSRFTHEVLPVLGPEPRITLGGFFARDKEHRSLYFWG